MNTDLTVYSQTLFTLINTPLFKLGTQPVNLLWLLKFLLLFSVVILTTQWSKQILKRRILVSLVTNEGDRNIIANTASFTLAIIGILLIMQAMGLKLESLAIVVGGLGVGIGHQGAHGIGHESLNRGVEPAAGRPIGVEHFLGAKGCLVGKVLANDPVTKGGEILGHGS